MAGRGKSINLFLMDGDGDPNGRIKCTLANWTGVVYKIPRTELDNARSAMTSHRAEFISYSEHLIRQEKYLFISVKPESKRMDLSAA